MKFITDNQGVVLLLILLAAGYVAWNTWDKKKKANAGTAAM